MLNLFLAQPIYASDAHHQILERKLAERLPGSSLREYRYNSTFYQKDYFVGDRDYLITIVYANNGLDSDNICISLNNRYFKKFLHEDAEPIIHRLKDLGFDETNLRSGMKTKDDGDTIVFTIPTQELERVLGE